MRSHRQLRRGDLIIACAHVAAEDGRIRPGTLWEWPSRLERLLFVTAGGAEVQVEAIATCAACQVSAEPARHETLIEITVPPTLEAPTLH